MRLFAPTVRSGGSSTDHRKRHERWRNLIHGHARFFLDEVMARVVPKFERRGFVWYGDYAGGDRTQVGANEIPLQRRSGPTWDTVELQFDRGSAPWLAVNFASLPPICRRMTPSRSGSNPSFSLVDVPREQASIVDAPALFRLARGQRRQLDSEFGYKYFHLRPRRFLTREVDLLLSLLPELFRRFDQGLPREWLDAGLGAKVAEHATLMLSLRLKEQQLERLARRG